MLFLLLFMCAMCVLFCLLCSRCGMVCFVLCAGVLLWLFDWCVSLDVGVIVLFLVCAVLNGVFCVFSMWYGLFCFVCVCLIVVVV